MRTQFTHWRLSSFYFFYYAALAAWIPYWGTYLSHRGFGVGFIGLSMATIFAMRIVGSAIWGYLGDKFQNHLALIRLGAILSCISYMGLVFVDAHAMIFLIPIVTSCFWSGILPQFEMITLQKLDQTPENYSWVRLWGSGGFVCAVIGLGFVYGWLSVLVLPYFVWICMLFASLLTFTVSANTQTINTTQPNSLLPLLGNPVILFFLLGCVLIHFSHGPYYSFYSIYLANHGYSHGTIGMLWALGVISEMVIFIWLPRVMLRYWVALLLFSILLTATRWGMIAWSDGQLWVLLLAQLLHAASFGSFHAVGIEWIRRVFLGNLAGRGQALYNSIGFGVGGMLGAVVTGMFWSDYGATLIYTGATLISLLALIFCVPAMLHVRRHGGIARMRIEAS